MSFGFVDPQADAIASQSDEASCAIQTRDVMRRFIGTVLSSAPTPRRRKARATGVARGFVDALAPILGSGRTAEDAVAEMDRIELAIIREFAAQRAARLDRSAARLASLREPLRFGDPIIPLPTADADDASANDTELSA